MIALGIGTYFVISIFADKDVLNKQFLWLSNYKYDSSQERVEYWKRSVEMWKDNPVFGVGTGNWRINIPNYGTDELRAADGLIHFQRPHNDFIWVLSETGIFGFFGFLSLFVTSLYYVFRVIVCTESKDKLLLMLFVFFGLVGYIIISLFSFPKERIIHFLFLNIFFGLIIINYRKIKPLKYSKRNLLKYLIFILPLLLMFSTFFTYKKMNGEYHLRKALMYRSKSQYDKMIIEIDKAYSLYYTLDNACTPVLWYKGEALFTKNKIDEAFIAYKQSYNVHPFHMHVLNNLASCYELKNDPKNAQMYYLKAIEISGKFDDARLNLCASYYNSGKLDKAYCAIRHVEENGSVKFKHFLLVILKEKTRNLILNHNNKKLIKTIERIQYSDDWLNKVHFQSKNDSNTFEEQMLIEAVYLLESVDSTISPDYANEMRNKYKLKNATIL